MIFNYFCMFPGTCTMLHSFLWFKIPCALLLILCNALSTALGLFPINFAIVWYSVPSRCKYKTRFSRSLSCSLSILLPAGNIPYSGTILPGCSPYPAGSYQSTADACFPQTHLPPRKEKHKNSEEYVFFSLMPQSHCTSVSRCIVLQSLQTKFPAQDHNPGPL